MLNAIPLNLNGLVTPTPLVQFDAAEMRQLKRAFRGFEGRYECQLSIQDLDLHSSEHLIKTLCKDLSIAQARQIVNFMRPQIECVHRDDLFTIEGGSILINAQTVSKDSIHLETSDDVHVDISVMKYQEELSKGRITLRGLMATSNGPSYFDITPRSNVFELLRPMQPLPDVEKVCDEQHVLKSNDGEVILCDMVTPHKAHPKRYTGIRVLPDLRIKAQLVPDWRERLLKRQQAALRF